MLEDRYYFSFSIEKCRLFDLPEMLLLLDLFMEKTPNHYLDYYHPINCYYYYYYLPHFSFFVVGDT